MAIIISKDGNDARRIEQSGVKDEAYLQDYIADSGVRRSQPTKDQSMTDARLCRIGVFYDGSYFTYAQHHFYHSRKLGWLEFRAFHSLIETFIRTQEQGFASYKVVYAAWFQGLHTSTQSDEKKLRQDRNRYHDLMHSGIEPKFLPMSMSQGEKGADVALAIDALQTANDGKIDVAVLATATSRP